MSNQGIECSSCSGTGEGHNGRVCSACRGRGERFIAIPHDGSLCAMEGEEIAPANDVDTDAVLSADPTFQTICDERSDRAFALQVAA